MRHEYDLFERFPDGSSLWRASARGLQNARFHLSDLAKESANQFYAINVVSGKVIIYGISEREFTVARIGGHGRTAAA